MSHNQLHTITIEALVINTLLDPILMGNQMYEDQFVNLFLKKY